MLSIPAAALNGMNRAAFCRDERAHEVLQNECPDEQDRDGSGAVAKDHADAESEQGGERGEQQSPECGRRHARGVALSSPPSTAPLSPPIIPSIPIARPKPAATAVLAATMTQRAGCAATAVGDGAVLDLGGEHQGADDGREHRGEPRREDEGVTDVNGRFVSGSILTNVARIHDNRTPMTGVRARIATLDRSDDTLIHSLRIAVGSRRCRARRERPVTRWVAGPRLDGVVASRLEGWR